MVATVATVVATAGVGAVAACAGAAAASSSAAAAAAAAGAGAVGATGVAAGGSAATVALVGLLSGPVGWVLVGCSDEEGAAAGGAAAAYTWDCAAPVLRVPPTGRGVQLRDLLLDARIASVEELGDVAGLGVPSFLVRNVWNEGFTVQPVQLACGMVAYHCSAV